MKLKVIKISVAKDHGNGWINVEFSDFENSLSSLYLIIERAGLSEQFLSETGWRVSETKIEVNCTANESGNSIILLPPSIVQFLQTNFNYTFHLYNISSNDLGKFVISWRGVPSFRPQPNSKGILNLSPSREPKPIDPFAHSPSVSTQIRSVEPESVHVDIVLNKLTNEEPSNLLLPKLSQPDLDVFNPVNLSIGGTEIAPQAIGALFSLEPIKKVRIHCSNPKCNLEILNTMTKCPFCGHIQLAR